MREFLKTFLYGIVTIVAIGVVGIVLNLMLTYIPYFHEGLIVAAMLFIVGMIIMTVGFFVRLEADPEFVPWSEDDPL